MLTKTQEQSITTLPELFFTQAEILQETPFLYTKKGATFSALSWTEVSEKCIHLGKALLDLDVKAGDRIVLLSENRPEWLISDIAIMSTGAITVPAYTTNTVEDHRYLLKHSGATMVIASTIELAKKALEAMEKIKSCSTLVLMGSSDEAADLSSAKKRVISWRDLLEKGKNSDAPLKECWESIEETKTACLIFTSGTSANPKAVELSHKNVLTNIKGCLFFTNPLNIDPTRDSFLSLLPLSHSYEHTAGQFLPMFLGCPIYYLSSLNKLLDDLNLSKPAISLMAPRVLEVMRDKILSKLEKQSPLKRRIFLRAVELGQKEFLNPGSLTFFEKWQNKRLDTLVRRKFIARFGGSLKAIVSGGAPLNEEVGLFFQSMGLTILQGYGQTEASPIIAANIPGMSNLKSVGPALPNIDLEFAPDGEILIKSDSVMKGYWNDPKATKKAIIDGWLHTGDMGQLDPQGRLHILDRKKDIIVLSGGDNVSPARIESLLTFEPEFEQAMVYGNSKSHLVALVVITSEFLEKCCASHKLDSSLPLEELMQNKRFMSALNKAVGRVNKKLSKLEKVRSFICAKEAFSIETGSLTPTLKLKRHVVTELYRDKLDALYKK